LLSGVGVAVSNIPFMTKGLQEYEALFMVTLFEGCHITVACVSGAWVLKEMDHEAPERAAMYWACVLLIVAGLLIIQTTTSGSSAAGGGQEDKRATRQHEQSQPHRPLTNASARSVTTAYNVEDVDVEVPEPSPGLPPPTAVPSRQGSRTSTLDSAAAGKSSGPITSGVVVWAGSLSGIGAAEFIDVDEDDSSGEEDDGDDETASSDLEDGKADRDDAAE